MIRFWGVIWAYRLRISATLKNADSNDFKKNGQRGVSKYYVINVTKNNKYITLRK